ncbi:MAG: hypothetical protein AAF514_24045, partial [Verrucomicrobiota bacterium]
MRELSTVSAVIREKVLVSHCLRAVIVCLSISIGLTRVSGEAADPANRIWTERDSGKEIQATIMGLDGNGHVLLRQKGRKQPNRVALKRLSDEDRSFARLWVNLDQAWDRNRSSRWVADLSGQLINTNVTTSRGKRVFETAHFRFESDTPLAPSLAADFSKIFEMTYGALDTLPLGLKTVTSPEGKFK